MKTALITGITGQIGSYLAEYLLEKKYKVFGLVRRTSLQNTDRINHIENQLTLLEGDLLDQNSLISAIKIAKPDEIYSLAAQSHVHTSFEQPEFTANCTGLGVLRLLEAVRLVNKDIKIYQSSSSELFGKVKESPQSEKTPFNPQSPYAVAKLFAHTMCDVYRKSYGMYITCGILFNTESPRRGTNFVTRKITQGVAKIKLKIEDKLYLGNIEAKRDWGYAGDAVRAMWLMMNKQKSVPEDFVIATGRTHSIKDFLESAFGCVDLNWQDYVQIDPKFIRPSEVDILRGNYKKIKKTLGWQPEVKFRTLVKMMVQSDLDLIQQF